MRLSDLEQYNNIIVQCHDNPDADTIASGFGVYNYFFKKEKNVRLIYSGQNKIQKSNLVMMVDYLKIPIEYVDSIAEAELLITIDCQYEAGNIKKLPAKNVAIIDHHLIENTSCELTEIRSYLGSCCTLVWSMLLEENFPVHEDIQLSTALYYGLFSDTNNFSEIYHPIDKDMRDTLKVDLSIITQLKNSNLSLSELEIAGLALIRHTYHQDNRFAIIKSKPCDPNILGLISDLVQQVDSIDICVVYNETINGYKFSIRSCIKEVHASELAEYITESVGSGGGHIEKAGAVLFKRKFNHKYPNISIEHFLLNKMHEYFKSYVVIHADRANIDTNLMTMYKKIPVIVGYVKTTDILPVNTPIMIRTIEGDINLLTQDDLYIMIGIKGDVHPIKKDKFEKSYRLTSEPITINAQYIPSVKNLLNGKSHNLLHYANSCITTGETFIYAKPIEIVTKVFTAWDPNKYMYGKIGDYLVVRSDDPNDVYIIDKEIFSITYRVV